MVVMLGLLSTGVAYAHWSETLFIQGTVDTGEVDWEFIFNNETQKDHGLDWTSNVGMTEIWQLDKDVGSTTIGYRDTDTDGDYDTMDITLNNVYPCFFEHISFMVRCNGTVPIIYKQAEFYVGGDLVLTLTSPGYFTLDLDGDGYADVEIRWGDSFGTQLHYNDELDMSFKIHVLQEAPQSAQLSLSIHLIAVQWNE